MTQYWGPGIAVSTTRQMTLSIQGPPIHSWVHDACAWGAKPMTLAAPRDAAKRMTRFFNSASCFRCRAP